MQARLFEAWRMLQPTDLGDIDEPDGAFWAAIP
jgi:hypothetical protein